MKNTNLSMTTIRCDREGCDALYTSGSMRGFAIKQSKRAGWARLDRMDLCPTHAPVHKQWMREQVAARAAERHAPSFVPCLYGCHPTSPWVVVG